MTEKKIVSDDNTEMTIKPLTGYRRKIFVGFFMYWCLCISRYIWLMLASNKYKSV